MQIDEQALLNISLNGHVRQIRAGSTLADLLQELQVTSKYVVVQMNGDIVPRTEFSQVALNEGARLEVITLVGGG